MLCSASPERTLVYGGVIHGVLVLCFAVSWFSNALLELPIFVLTVVGN